MLELKHESQPQTDAMQTSPNSILRKMSSGKKYVLFFFLLLGIEVQECKEE